MVAIPAPLTVIVIVNNTPGQIQQEQVGSESRCDLQPIDFAKHAQACSGAGYTVEDPRQLRIVLREALQSPVPALVECVVDPCKPPMLAKATVKQGVHLAEALMRGEPSRERIALTIFRDKLKDLER